MRFITLFHAAITDPSFYNKELKQEPVSTIFLYLLIILTVFAFFLSTNEYTSITNKKNGLPAILPDVLNGVSISGHGLVTDDNNSFVADHLATLELMRLMKIPIEAYPIQDTLIVVDPHNLVATHGRVIHFSKDSIEFSFAGEHIFSIPYANLILPESNVDFSSKHVLRYFRRNALFLFVGFFATSFLIQFLLGLIVFFFQFLAAFILLSKDRHLRAYILRVSLFSLTPFLLISFVAMITGTYGQLMFNIAAFLSFIVLYRAVLFNRRNDKKYLHDRNE